MSFFVLSFFIHKNPHPFHLFFAAPTTHHQLSYTAEVTAPAGAVPPYSRGPHKNQMSNPPTGKNTISKLQRMISRVPRRLRQTLLRATASAITNRISTSKDQRELSAMVECSGGGGNRSFVFEVLCCVCICVCICVSVVSAILRLSWSAACAPSDKKINKSGEERIKGSSTLVGIYINLSVCVSVALSVTLPHKTKGVKCKDINTKRTSFPAKAKTCDNLTKPKYLRNHEPSKCSQK